MEDYEDFYLFDGVFIYPDSYPFHSHHYGEKYEMPEGKKQFLEKYETIIKKAKALHYNFGKFKTKK